MIPFLSSPKSSNTALMSVKINFKQVRPLILELNFRSQSNSCIHCIHVSFCQLDFGWSLLGRGDNCKLYLVYIAFMGHHSFLNFLNILFEFHDFQGIWLTVIDFFSRILNYFIHVTTLLRVSFFLYPGLLFLFS